MIIRRASDIAALITAVRTELGLTQDQLAKRTGVSRVWLGMVEHGKQTTRLDLVLRILNELDITLHAYGPDQTPLATDEIPGKEPKTTIDIDAIADMGLETIEDKATETPRPQRKRKPSR